MTFDFKNGSKTDLKLEYNRIAKEIGDDQFFTKKELNHLPKILAEGEQILAFTSGLMNGNTWLITLTDRRIIFLDKGMIFGLKQTTIDLDKVNSVSGTIGLIFGVIKIEDGAAQREIRNVWKKSVVKFTNKVSDAIEKRKALSRSSHSSNESEDDVISKIERLASLFEKGLINEMEFIKQKQKLLS